ncbi:ABC transporter ATP-binding protein [Streptomyces abikoensis]|uniref:ABC transporter ATP-binding protein n=1 Tax=Streptomyces abikoensis TaxID=97398 RepID=UPI00371DAABF
MSAALPVDVRRLTYDIAGRRLLDEADLAVSPAESVAVMGPSGSGKSTLLSLLMGLVKPTSGKVAVAGRDVADLRQKELAELRRSQIGMVFQFGELLPELEPVENVALAGLLGGTAPDQAYSKARGLLERLGVPMRSTVTTAELSGGERQRVAVARALMGTPSVLLADEPTGSLDERSREVIADLLFSLPKREQCALVVVTHDPSVANRADRVLHLRDGRLIDAAQALGGAL